MNWINAKKAQETCPACGKAMTEHHKLLLVILVPVLDPKTGQWVKEPTHPGNPNLN